jgi:hypothetical protein
MQRQDVRDLLVLGTTTRSWARPQICWVGGEFWLREHLMLRLSMGQDSRQHCSCYAKPKKVAYFEQCESARDASANLWFPCRRHARTPETG